MATVHPYHYQPTEAQKKELAVALDKIRAAHAARRSQSARAQPIFDMLSVVVAARPLDNPVIESRYGDL